MLSIDGSMSQAFICPTAESGHEALALTPQSSSRAQKSLIKTAYRAIARGLMSRSRKQFQMMLLISFLAWMLGAAMPLWATQTLTFNGVVSVLSMPGISLSGPAGIVTDTSWNVYISDTGNNRIVKISARGTASVLPLTGLSAPSTLSAPKGLALDASGDLLIADSGNSRIVKVDRSGNGSVVSTGSISLSAPVGVAVDASGDIFIADTGNDRIVKAPANGAPTVYSITGLASPSTLSSPSGLAEDAFGNLYIADAGNSRIVKVSPGGVGSKLAITGTTPTTPTSVSMDTYGNLYITDTSGSKIIAVTTALVGSNFSVKYGLSNSSPAGVAVDLFGNVFVADTGNNQVDKVQTTSVTFGHNALGTNTSQSFDLVIGSTSGPNLTNLIVTTYGKTGSDFTVGSGTTCVSGTSNPSTCKISVQYHPSSPGYRKGGMVLTYSDTSVSPQAPRHLTVPLYAFNDSPQAVLSPGTASVVSSGSLVTQIPYGITVDGSGNVYVGNAVGKNVVKINAGGASSSVVSTVGATNYTLGTVNGVVIDGIGNLFIADNQNSTIYEVTLAGTTYPLSINIAGSPISLSGPTALAIDGGGNLFIADNGNNRILKVATQDPSLPTALPLNATVVNSGGYTFSGNTITGLAVDASENLYVVDSVNSTVIKITAAGAWSTVSFPGLTLNSPEGVAVDGMGNVYVSDAGNSRIVKLTTAGIGSVIPIQGLPSPSTLGGGSGNHLYGLSVDSSGNIYIADSTNNRVVMVDVSGASMTFANTRVGFTSTDSPQTATVTNIGNQTLTFSANPTYTLDFPEDAGDSNPCTSVTSLSPGYSCDVAVKFSPQSALDLHANITVTNNDRNVAGSAQLVAVRGTGLYPGDVTSTAVSVNPSVITYGNAVTITATVSDTTSVSTTPTGSITFTDLVGTTTIHLNSGNPISLSGGVATLPNVQLSGIGTHTITATYAGVNGTFLDSSGNTTAVINKSNPTINWTPPSTITYGTTLSAILNATAANGSTSAVGTFAYTATPTGGSASPVTSATVLGAGSYSLTVTFTPTDTTNYNSVSSSVSFTVNKATPAITWAMPGAITYGTVLSASQLNASAGSVAGTFTYSPAAGTVLSAGSQTLSVTFTPTDTTNYNTVSSSVSIAVNKAAPAITWATPSAITYGTALSASQLNASAGSVAGTFTYSPAAGTVLSAGSQTLSVTFTPTDTTNYNTVSSSVSIAVNKAAPAITWATPSAITYGTALSASQLNASAGSVAGTFSYSPAIGTLLPVGSQTLSVTFTPTDTTDYTTASDSVSLTVNKASALTSVVSSSNPVLATTAVTFTSTVSSSSSTPTGTVTFYDGPMLLGTAALLSGTASYTTANLVAGHHAITATYSGDSNFASSTSAILSELVQDYSVSTIGGGSGNGDSGSTQTVLPGGTAIYSLVLGPSNGTTFPAPITLSVSGVPPGATATITPQILPAGSSLTNVTLSIQLPKTTAKTTPNLFRRGAAPLVFGLLFLPFAGRLRKTSHKLGSLTFTVLFSLLGLASMVGLTTGCGSTSGFFASAPASYIITITATSGSVQHSTTVTLNVQ